VTIFNQATRGFEFHPGPVFANIVIADEINRASPKTQSALLEVMEERTVTVDGVRHPVPQPFLVVATQNPVEMDGTYRLPEAQLDRFLLRTSLGYPQRSQEIDAVRSVTEGVTAEGLPGVIDRADVDRMIRVANGAYIDDAVIGYAVDLTVATRSLKELRLGASTRGVLALVRASKALAVTQGRPFVTIDDVKALAPAALGHRMLLTPDAELRGVRTVDLVDRLLDVVEAPLAVRTGP
jgi:MoxR-like ATPase